MVLGINFSTYNNNNFLLYIFLYSLYYLYYLQQRQNPPKTITYGTTELLTAQEFIDQLNTLGTEN